MSYSVDSSYLKKIFSDKSTTQILKIYEKLRNTRQDRRFYRP